VRYPKIRERIPGLDEKLPFFGKNEG